MKPDEFIKTIGELARKDMEATGILASVTIVQAILESNWGESGLTKNAKNLFGMKAGKSWTGARYNAKTKEQTKAGVEYTVDADFRAYDTWIDSIADHSKYLTNAMNGSKPRYAGIVGQTDPRTVANIIKNGGYATDVKYVDKLCNLINQYNLTEYDKPAEAKYEVGWHEDDIGWWYADSKSTYYKSCWQTINHHWYYFGEDGYILTGWHVINGEKYYFEEANDDGLKGAMYGATDRGVQSPMYVE